MTKIWANSADSHVLEPADLWLQSLPPRLAQRAPRAERGDKYEILYIDGERVDRQLNDFMDAIRPPGARDLDIRLKDLDQEGVWGQLAFPSMGFWTVKIKDRELARETVRTWNDWARAEILSKNKRVIPTACVSRGHRRRGRRSRARRRARLPGRVPAQPDSPRRGVRDRGVGAVLGRRGAGRHRARLPHRHRRGHGGVPGVLPPARRIAQVEPDADLHRPAPFGARLAGAVVSVPAVAARVWSDPRLFRIKSQLILR